MSLVDKDVGDEVYLDCYSSMGASSTGRTKVLDVAYKYDADTGARFKILKVHNKWYDTRNGKVYPSSSWMYFIEDIKT